MVSGETRRRRPGVRIVEKNFVRDERNFARGTELIQPGGFFSFYIGAGGIVGMDDQDGPRRWMDFFLQCFEINVPPMVVKKRVVHQANIVEVGQKLEQRIAGRRNQNFVIRIAEQAEEKRISLAGAGGEKDFLGIKMKFVLRIAAGIINGDSLPS